MGLPPGNGGPAQTCRARSLGNERAIYEELDQTCTQAARIHGVGSGEGVDLEPVVCGLRMEDSDRGPEAAHLQAARVSADIDRVVALGPLDDDAVGLAITSGAAE